jgi:hypothetical protein
MNNMAEIATPANGISNAYKANSKHSRVSNLFFLPM